MDTQSRIYFSANRGTQTDGTQHTLNDPEFVLTTRQHYTELATYYYSHHHPISADSRPTNFQERIIMPIGEAAQQALQVGSIYIDVADYDSVIVMPTPCVPHSVDKADVPPPPSTQQKLGPKSITKIEKKDQPRNIKSKKQTNDNKGTVPKSTTPKGKPLVSPSLNSSDSSAYDSSHMFLDCITPPPRREKKKLPKALKDIEIVDEAVGVAMKKDRCKKRSYSDSDDDFEVNVYSKKKPRFDLNRAFLK